MVQNKNRVAVAEVFLRLSFFCLFAVLVFLCSAQARAAGSARSIGEILSKTEGNYRTIHAFTAIFSQKSVSSAATTLGAEKAGGKLYYAKPHQMLWEYDKPEKQEFVANNKLAWLYTKDERRITLFEAQKLFASPLASIFFGGALRLRDNFNVTLDPTLSTPATAVLRLAPLHRDPSIKLAYLWIDLRTYQISRVQTQDLMGNTNEITINSFTPRSSLDPGLFRLQVPPTVKVFDSNGRMLTTAQIEQLQSEISSGK
ncbi:MAG: outer membrane lipoprotein carrier protein LolA [Syntrophobacteraceae bacterium]|nr:outer membrane lipoprotein carrier protein LolA [Syntrophobacteraceae bacterium]